MPPGNAADAIRWGHQDAWNKRTEARVDEIEDRVTALEHRGYFVSGVAAAVGAMLGSGIVASLFVWLVSR